jgi:clan AA aspartic protease (TIGR02281 family)
LTALLTEGFHKPLVLFYFLDNHLWPKPPTGKLCSAKMAPDVPEFRDGIGRLAKTCIGMPAPAGRLHGIGGPDQWAAFAVAFCPNGRNLGRPGGQRNARARPGIEPVRFYQTVCISMATLRIIRAALALALVLTASPVAAALIGAPASQAREIVPVEAHDGAYVVPVLINGVLTMKFIIDSGSADVSIPAEVAFALKRLGTISGDDFIGSKIYTLADGSRVPSETYRISSLKIGDLVMQNVTVRVAAEKSSLLLGQSFLSRLKSWSMDNNRQMLIIN